MTSERWRQVEQIYQAALQHPPTERSAFLESACGGDEPLRREVERLITANDRAGEFLASPAWQLARNGLAAGVKSVMRNSLPTAIGSRTSRTSRAYLRSMFNDFIAEAKSASRRLAAPRCAGLARARNCFTSRWTDV